MNGSQQRVHADDGRLKHREISRGHTQKVALNCSYVLGIAPTYRYALALTREDDLSVGGHEGLAFPQITAWAQG